MTSEKVAVVTGSNRGIGYAMVQGLCERFDGKVYLTARNVVKGLDAVRALKDLGLNPTFHQLDVKDPQSIHTFKTYIMKEHGGIDILINNAAHYYPEECEEPFWYQAVNTINTNYFGTQKVCQAFFPIFRQDARIVNISSTLGHLSMIPGESLKNKLASLTLTEEKLNKLMTTYLNDTRAGIHEEEGWGKSCYAVSKVAISALTIVHQRRFDNEKPCRNISTNSVHPGYVNTSMSNHVGSLTITEGASAPLYLALDDHGLKGQYVWYNKRVKNWYSNSISPL